ncbi:inositol monophosphatase family protein [Bartonella sp. SD1336NMGDW]|uniref:inositol monophosphatase family protein n=1 Tax=Bartonella sp. SD1336NMGDW TaxID=3243575 RepID=UPI0035D0EE91
MMEVSGLRLLSTATLDLAYVTAEKTDGFWEDNLQFFDRTTGILIVRKAGGFVTDKEGGSDIFCKKISLLAMNTFASN